MTVKGRDPEWEEIDAKLRGDEVDEIDDPGEHDDENDERDGPQEDRSNRMEPLMQRLAPLKKFILAGSCCTGVAALYAISSWDHGLMPGLPSPFARADSVEAIDQKYKALQSDVAELYTLSLVRAIRDLEADYCKAPSRALADQIDSLQYKYEARTGKRYPHEACS